MMKISPLDPIGPAWDHMVKVLFKTFSFKKWFVLGFCAFLAQCGEGGGSGANAPSGNSGNVDGNDMRQWFEQNLDLIIAITIAVTLVIIVWTIVALWLNSRGKFMFIDGIVKNRGAVVEPWCEYKQEGNSLFMLRLVLTIVLLVAFIVLAGIPILIALPDIRAEHFGGAATLSIVLGGLFLIGYILICIAIQFFIGVFVTPTMYLRRVPAIQACRIAWHTLVKGHIWSAVLLALMMFLFGIAAATISFMAICLTCFLAALPYIGTVILLPIPVFFTAYALKYLEQFGDDWRFFPPDNDCASCGYDLSGNPDSTVCPECGQPTGTMKTIPASTD